MIDPDVALTVEERAQDFRDRGSAGRSRYAMTCARCGRVYRPDGPDGLGAEMFLAVEDGWHVHVGWCCLRIDDDVA